MAYLEMNRIHAEPWFNPEPRPAVQPQPSPNPLSRPVTIREKEKVIEIKTIPGTKTNK